MYRTVIVPLDGSPLAERAIPIATTLASAMRARLSLVRVHNPMPADWEERAWEGRMDAPWNGQIREDEDRYLAQLTRELHASRGVQVDHAVLDGVLPDAISRIANRTPNALVVMSTHGRTGFSRLWLGSVADAIVRHTVDPVLLVRGDDATPPAPAIDRVRQILVPLDGSLFAEAVIPHAAALAHAMNARLMLMQVVHPVWAPAFASISAGPTPYFDPAREETATGEARSHAENYVARVAADLRSNDASLDIMTDVRVDPSVAASILECSVGHGADMIALSSHGRGASRLVFGSVADKLLRGGPATILLIRPNRV